MANHIESLFIDDLLLNYLDDFCNNAGVSRSVFLKNFYTTVAKMGSSPKCWCKLNSANLSFHKLKHTGFF